MGKGIKLKEGKSKINNVEESFTSHLLTGKLGVDTTVA